MYAVMRIVGVERERGHRSKRQMQLDLTFTYNKMLYKAAKAAA